MTLFDSNDFLKNEVIRIIIYNENILSILYKNAKSKNIKGKITKNNKPYIIGNCNICNELKSKFISIKQIRGNGIWGNSFKNIPILDTIF